MKLFSEIYWLVAILLWFILIYVYQIWYSVVFFFIIATFVHEILKRFIKMLLIRNSAEKSDKD